MRTRVRFVRFPRCGYHSTIHVPIIVADSPRIEQIPAQKRKVLKSTRMATKRPTVMDVAKLAHVGGSTVSRFLRGIPVRPGVAERIAEAVKELGYEPDETARALRAGRSRTIGVILPKISNVFFSQAMQLIEEQVRQRGCTVILLTHQDRLTHQFEHLATLKRYRADGLIMTCASGTTIEGVRGVLPELPIVAFDSFFSQQVDSVLLRNREAARLATEHLLGHGYTRIACVTGKPEVFSFTERAAGYKEAMDAQKLETRLITAPDYDQLRFVLGSAIRSKNRPDALLSLSDFATLNVMTTFEELGLSQHERLPLIGFDDFGFAPLVDPPLTVIRQPIEKMVRYALNALFRRIDAETAEDPQTIALPGELITRRSCGCL
jgi:LacI family transcriptional regulator